MVFHFATSLREICIVREIVIVQVSRFVVFADVIIDFLGVVRAEAVLGAHASSSLIPAKRLRSPLIPPPNAQNLVSEHSPEVLQVARSPGSAPRLVPRNGRR